MQSASRNGAARPSPRSFPRAWRPVLWTAAVLLALLVLWQLAMLLRQPPASSTEPLLLATPTPTVGGAGVMPTPDPRYTPAATTSVATTPAPPDDLPYELATPTVAAGDRFFNITAAAGAVGWVASNDDRGNHLGDSFIHAGTVQGNVFHGLVQFDLKQLPRGADLHYVTVLLFGRDDARLDRQSNASWQLRWLANDDVEDWARQTFQTLHNAPVQQTILPIINQDALAPAAVNAFVFSPEQRALLQQALVDGDALLALRIDGPESGADTLFTWDSGYGAATWGSPPRLWVVTGPEPATPPPIPTQDYVVVTSTPTPANVLTAAAIQLTVEAVGTSTPLPRSYVTATPTALNESTVAAERLLQGLPLVVTATLPPRNPATATAEAAYATAVALTTGTWTPLPTDYVTATPTATFVVVTNTPTASTISELLDRVIVEATRTATAGPPTPWPAGVVTATPARPAPQNAATAEAQVILVTIEAIVEGNVWTPTATATRPAPSGTPVVASATVTLQQGAPVAVVVNPLVNVRRGPAITFAVLAQIAQGVQLSVTGRSADAAWLSVCCINGESGWIATSLMSFDFDPQTLPVR